MATALLLGFSIGCREEPEPPPPADPNGQVVATVASFAMTTEPGGAETIHTIAFHDGRVRFGEDRNVWRLIDLEREQVTQIDEIARTVDRIDFAALLGGLREATARATDSPVATVEPTDELRDVAGFQARKYRSSVGRAIESEVWLSQRPLFHSDLYLLELATSAIADEELPASKELIDLVGRTGGYPVIIRSAMRFDGVEYRTTKTLVAVAEQTVPASWFVLPEWDDPAPVTESRDGRPPVASPRSDRNAPAGGSRPSGSD